MAFTGYVFNSEEEVMPFVEEAEGPTFRFCRDMALRLTACVVAGYPELAVDGDTGRRLLFNSMCIVNERGELVKTYRKSFLYETDKAWATKSTLGFTSCELLGWKVGFAICMDINPEEFDFDSDTFSFASFCRDADVQVVLFSTNWIRGGGPPIHKYWAWRFTPMIGHPCLLVAANRIGLERGTEFAGESCVMSLREPRLLATADVGSEKLVLSDVRLPRHSLARSDCVVAASMS